MFKYYQRVDSQAFSGQDCSYWSEVWNRWDLSNEKQIDQLEKTPRWQEIARRVPSGSRLLEAGCGLGSWVRFLRKRGYNVVGIDFVSEILQRVRTDFGPLQLTAGDIRALPFPGESFDSVLSWGVIEHLEEGPYSALNEFWRVLRPGGSAFLTVPYINQLRRRTAFTENGDNLPPGKEDQYVFHQYFFTRSQLAECCRQCGFRLNCFAYERVTAKTLLPIRLRERFPLATRVLNRTLTPPLRNILSPELLSSMILAVVSKPALGGTRDPAH